MITTSQIFLSAIILFVIYRTVIAYKRKNLSRSFVSIWVTLWLVGLVAIFQQDLIIEIAHRIGISRGVDLVIYICLIVIFYLIYRLLVQIKELEKKITDLISKLALDESKKRH